MIQRAVSAALFLLFSALVALAQPVPEAQANVFLDFVRDASDNDARLIALARDIVADPNDTLDTLGIAVPDTSTASERALLGILGLLAYSGDVVVLEDKNIHELPYALEARGWAAGDGDPDLDIFGELVEIFAEERDPTSQEWEAFRARFPKHIEKVESSVLHVERELLSVRAPGPKKMYFWAPRSDVARKWRGTANFQSRNTEISVTEPDWETYWKLLTNGLGMPEAYRTMPVQE